jgi:hypothetical protein
VSKSSCCCRACWLMFDYDLHPPSRAEKISEEGYEMIHSAVEAFWTCMWGFCCPNCFWVWFLCFPELGSIFLLPLKFWGCQLHVHYLDTGMVIKHENLTTCQNPLKKH